MGKNKKEAKIAAARCAFAALLDLDAEAFDTKFSGKYPFILCKSINGFYSGMSQVKFDRHGHRLVENGSNDPGHLFTSTHIQELTEKLNLLTT